MLLLLKMFTVKKDHESSNNRNSPQCPNCTCGPRIPGLKTPTIKKTHLTTPQGRPRSPTLFRGRKYVSVGGKKDTYNNLVDPFFRMKTHSPTKHQRGQAHPQYPGARRSTQKVNKRGRHPSPNVQSPNFYKIDFFYVRIFTGVPGSFLTVFSLVLRQ